MEFLITSAIRKSKMGSGLTPENKVDRNNSNVTFTSCSFLKLSKKKKNEYFPNISQSVDHPVYMPP